jgi:predicted SprT family Zn-dependent metalloprotease
MSQPEDEKPCFNSALDGEPWPSGGVVLRTNAHPGLRSEPEASVSYDTTDPTTRTYSELTDAYAFFNVRLFSAKLPACLITLQRRKRSYGYFSGERFTTRDGTEVADEIALNPSFFAECSIADILSTLVHEMVHLQQQHFGTPSRAGYHNTEWAGMMRVVGLIPSATGEPGGKETGQSVSHYIEEGGSFARACAELIGLREGMVPYIELGSEIERGTRERKASSKTKYTCPACGTNAWAKPDTRLVCGDCQARLEAALPR